MKTGLILGWLLALILFSASQVSGANYYFSTAAGDDLRSSVQAQNPQTPWKTIEKLNAYFRRLQPGDSVLFRRGEVFAGTILANKSGIEGRPIVLSAYGEGKQPVITGMAPVILWTAKGGGVFESGPLPVSSSLYMVTIGGKPFPMGRYPNPEASNAGYLILESHGANSITDKELPAAPNWKNAELVVRTEPWYIERLPVIAHSGTVITYAGAPSYSPQDGFGYFFQNHPQTLDQFGEWYFDMATKKLSVFFGASGPSGNDVQIGVEDILVNVQAHYIVIHDLAFSGANKYGIFSDWPSMKNLQVIQTQISCSGIDAVHLTGSRNFFMKDCLVEYSNSSAVYLDYPSPYAALTGNTLRFTGNYPGMLVKGQSYAILSYDKGLNATNNAVLQSGYIPIRFAGDSCLIKNNFIDTFCTVLDDGGGIYTYAGGSGNSMNNRVVEGNIVLHGLGAPKGTNRRNYYAAEGIYIDDNSANVAILGNTVAHCGNNGIKVHNSRNLTIEGNLLYDNQIQWASERDYSGMPASNLSVSDNVFVAKKIHQTTAYFRSQSKDFQELGLFSGNYYARPLDDQLTIAASYRFSSNSYRTQWYDLERWQKTYGKDQSAGKSPVSIVPYLLNPVSSVNKIKNGQFESGSIDFSCWSFAGGCSTSWKSKSPLDQGAIEISGTQFSLAAVQCGSVAGNKHYLLRFSAIAQAPAALEIYLRQAKTPYETISYVRTIGIGPQRKECELLFSFPDQEAAASLIFSTAEDQFTYWLDNIGLYEVDAKQTDADSYILFAYNPGSKDSVLFLDKGWTNIRKIAQPGFIVLKPFESIILFRDSISSSDYLENRCTLSSRLEDCQVRLTGACQINESFQYAELERSPDGISFLPLIRQVWDGTDGLHPFEYLDGQAGRTNYYRMKIVDKQGGITYSELTSEKTDCSPASIEIFPTLLHAGQRELTIRVYTTKPFLQFSIADQTGKPVKAFKVYTFPGWNTLRVDLTGLSPGAYFLFSSDPRIKGAPVIIISGA